MTQRKWNAIYVAAIIFSSATIAALVSGEVGYRRGDSYKNWEAHYDALRPAHRRKYPASVT